MEKWLVDTDLEAPPHHGSFLHLFEAQTQRISDRIVTTRATITDHHGNQHLPFIRWDQGPIEMIIVDYGRRLSVNDAWYSVFSPHFISDQTLVILQDWQNHKRVPEIYWENMKIFTDSKESSLEQVHELCDAGLATFLYRG